MERDEFANAAEAPAARVGRAAKWAFVMALAAVAGIVGILAIFRTHPAQATVRKAFSMVEQGDMEGFMEYVDPEGEFGLMWDDNERGVRDIVLGLMERYSLEFSSLEFATRAKRNDAEVELKGGRVTIYNKTEEGPPLAFFDLGESGLVIYLQKKGGGWLIEGMNYDIVELISEDSDLLPL